MRLLFLSLMVPVPTNNGHKMRTCSLLQALAAEDHKVTLLTFGATDEPDGHRPLLQELCREIEIVPIVLSRLSGGADYARRLRGLVSARPFAAERFASPAMVERIRHHLARGIFDAVVSDSIFNLVNLPPTPIPLLLNNVDVEHLILLRYLRFASNPAKRLYARLESRKLKAWELGACRRAAVGMACSEHDRRLLATFCPELPVVVVPNVVDADSYVPTGDGDGFTVLYQGAMDWYPNRDAVALFVSEILPELRSLVPGVKFVIAGRNPAEAFRRRFAGVPDVEFTGTVPDMRSLIARATVCVVPLRIGSGTRLKILEGAAMGKAIVSTHLGAEGLDFREGEEILLADEPRAFAHAIAGLLTDASRRARLGAAARRLVERQYSFPVLRAALRAALARAVSHRVRSVELGVS